MNWVFHTDVAKVDVICSIPMTRGISFPKNVVWVHTANLSRVLILPVFSFLLHWMQLPMLRSVDGWKQFRHFWADTGHDACYFYYCLWWACHTGIQGHFVKQKKLPDHSPKGLNKRETKSECSMNTVNVYIKGHFFHRSLNCRTDCFVAVCLCLIYQDSFLCGFNVSQTVHLQYF